MVRFWLHEKTMKHASKVKYFEISLSHDKIRFSPPTNTTFPVYFRISKRESCQFPMFSLHNGIPSFVKCLSFEVCSSVTGFKWACIPQTIEALRNIQLVHYFLRTEKRSCMINRKMSASAKSKYHIFQNIFVQIPFTD